MSDAVPTRPMITPDERVDRPILVVGIVVLLALTALNVDPLGKDWWRAVPAWMQLVILFDGLMFTVAGLAARSNTRVRGAASRSAPGEVAAVLAVTALAFALRAWRLEALRLLIDEGNSIDALFHATVPSRLLLPPSQYVTTLVYPTWQALVIEWAGGSLYGLRLSSAVLGALTVPALYTLARALFDRRVALLAALSLAVLPPHLHFSRLGLPHVMDTLVGTLALAGVARGMRTERRRDWAWAGVALGLTQYGFEAGRYFFTPLVAGWLVLVAASDQRALRRHRAGLFTMAAAAILSAMPVFGALLFAHSNAGVAPRWQASGLGVDDFTRMVAAPSEIALRLRDAALVYVSRPDQAVFYGGDHALVLPVVVPFLLLGALVSLTRWRSIRSSLRNTSTLVALWLAAAWFANAALRDSAVFPRWVVVLPAVALAVALGIDTATAWLPRCRTAASLLLAGGLALLQTTYYFGVHIERLAQQARADKPYRDAYDAVLRAAAALPPDTNLLFISDPPIDVHPPRSLRRLLGGQGNLDFVLPGDLDGQLAATGDDKPIAFFVAPHDETTVARLRRRFELAGPYSSEYPVAPDKRLTLYVGVRRRDRAHP